jgi:CxxC motif-containing protein (DUF1111 family)
MKTQTASLSRRIGLVLFVLTLAATFLFTQGRVGPPQVHAQTTLGGPLPNLTSGQLMHFMTGMTQFDFPWDPVHGLGPVYTNTNCNNCHAQPVFGGYNTGLRTTFFGTLNSDGSFSPLTNKGGLVLQPLSVSKFIPGCALPGETTANTGATIIAQRVPPPLFGAGLVDSIDDSAILANAVPKGLGISGVANMITDYTGVTRVGHFGRKAQFASLVQVVGEAFLHDIGITNPVAQKEDCPQGKCTVPPICFKKSTTKLNDTAGIETIQIFDFVVYLAPNVPGVANSNGQAQFNSVGCSLCHLPSYQTDPAVNIPTDFLGHFNGPIVALSNQPVNLYSDLLLHHMGSLLADGIGGSAAGFGQATGDQWRTVPLWGMSFRTVYLHDGRDSSVMQAIEDHFSLANGTYPASEANEVINNFNNLSPQDQADLISFVNSL